MLMRAAFAAMLVVSSGGWSARAAEPARLMSTKTVAEQRDVLSHAVQSAGHTCPVVTEHMYVGERQSIDFFSVRCENLGEYMVSIASAGEMQSRVMTCDVLAALNVQCFKPL
jgi:hypothetical protein